MNSRFSLLTRGIILVAAPFTMQLLLVLTLMLSLERVQEQASHEAYIRDLLAQTYSVCNSVPEIATLILLQRRSLELVSEDAVSKQLKLMKLRISNVERLAKKNPRQLANISKLEDGRKHLEVPDIDMLEDNESYRKKQLEQISALFNALSDMVQVEKIELAAAPKERAALRHTVILCILGWIAATIIVALCLARFYAQSIRDPLLRLAENARLLSQRHMLHHEMSGTDAIAEFDKTLHKVDAKLKVARENEELLVENAADLICTLSPNLTFLSANSFASRLLAVGAKQLQRQPAQEYIIESERSKFEAAMQLAKLETQTRFEIKMQRPEGTQVETLWSSLWSPVDNAYFCIVHDVTELKRIERIKQGFSAILSDDLRAPLNSVIDSMRKMENDPNSPITEVLRPEIQSVKTNLQWLIDMVTDLLDFEKLQYGEMNFKFESTRIQEIFHEAVSLVKEIATARSIAITIGETDRFIVVDRSRFTQLVVNLLANAIKFSPQGGKIDIAIEQLGDASLELSISDEGPGVPESFREKIFAPFEQVPDQTKSQDGTGLGLAICKSIADGHNAKIYVRPGARCGSQFCVQLSGDAVQ